MGEPTPETTSKGPLTLRYPLTPSESNAQHGLILSITEPNAPGGRTTMHLQSRTLSTAQPGMRTVLFGRDSRPTQTKAFEQVAVPISLGRFSGGQPLELTTLRRLHGFG